MFIGYIDNGEEFLKFGIKKKSSKEAWQKLLEVSEKVEEKYDDYCDNIQYIKLFDENMIGICDWDEDVERKLEEYDRKHCNEDIEMTLVNNEQEFDLDEFEK